MANFESHPIPGLCVNSMKVETWTRFCYITTGSAGCNKSGGFARMSNQFSKFMYNLSNFGNLFLCPESLVIKNFRPPMLSQIHVRDGP